MKRSTFILVGMLLTVLAIGIMSCGSPRSKRVVEQEQGMAINKSPYQNAKANTMEVNYSSQTAPVIIQTVGTHRGFDIHEVRYKGKTFLVFEEYKVGLAVYEITDTEQPLTMGQPRVLEPSKESLESLTNPEVRPVPVGSEEAFIAYHTGVKDISLVDHGGLP